MFDWDAILEDVLESMDKGESAKLDAGDFSYQDIVLYVSDLATEYPEWVHQLRDQFHQEAERVLKIAYDQLRELFQTDKQFDSVVSRTTWGAVEAFFKNINRPWVNTLKRVVHTMEVQSAKELYTQQTYTFTNVQAIFCEALTICYVTFVMLDWMFSRDS